MVEVTGPVYVAVSVVLLTAGLCSEVSGDARKSRSVSDVSRRAWPKGVIPYFIDSSFSGNDRQKILDAMAQWEQSTCIKFKLAAADEVAVKITLSAIPTECVTPVGYLGVDSIVKLGLQCMENLRSVIHELGHVLGLDHEHQHPDRQLTIYKENVVFEMLPFFDAFNRTSVNTFGIPYDPLSIMHYGSKAFSRNGQPTMKYNNTVINALMGWTNSPSSLSDIPAVRQLYGCPQDSPLPNYGIECKDYDQNCARIGSNICTITPDWAASTCLVTCGLCSNVGDLIVPMSRASVTDASGCSDAPFCSSRDGVCSGSYAAWARVNCPCKCSSSGVPSATWTATSAPASATLSATTSAPASATMSAPASATLSATTSALTMLLAVTSSIV